MNPEDVFKRAQIVIQEKDFNALFACLDPKDLMTIVKNSINRSLNLKFNQNEEFVRICEENGFQLMNVKEAYDAIVSYATSENAPNMKTKVKQYYSVLSSALKHVPNIARFTGDLEKYLRAVTGGGSVSLRLFIDEELTGIEVEKDYAFAVRQIRAGYREPIEFARRKGNWYIRLLVGKRTKEKFKQNYSM